MTQITRKSVPMRGLILLLAMFLSAGLVLTGCGDDDTATTPAPAPPPPPAPAPEPEPEPEPEPQAPGKPTGLHADVTETSITWHWNAVEGAIGYLVQVSTDEMFDDTDTSTPTAETSHTVSDLAPGTTLYGRVRAAGGTLEAPIQGDWATHVTATTNTPDAPVPPAAPSGLAATDMGMDFIEWTWTAVEGATGYYVQFSTDEGMLADADPMAVEGTSYRRDGLDAGTSAYLRVAATDGTLMSGWSLHATGMTTMPDAPVPPAAPMGFSLSATGADYIEWSWEAVDGATGYHVQFSTDEGMLMDSEAMAVDGTSHRQTGLSEGSAGYLRVRAVADDLAGMWTAHLTGMTGTTPMAPGNLAATVTGDSITWTWDEVDGADGYQIQYSADGVFTGSTETMDAEGTSYTRDELTAGTSAFLRVRATSGGTGIAAMLTSGWTMPEKGTTMTPQPPAVPTGLAAEGGDGSITWTWDEVEGATGYEVQFSTSQDFSDAETMMAEGTSYTMSDLGASTAGHLRVRAVNDAGMSAWTQNISGMTAAAAVEPAPALVVSFTIPDGKFPMEPDGEEKEAEAKASVHKEITVSSNAAATITPMFEPNANGQSLAADDGNMPFAFVTWSALQSAVVSEEGVTFKITRGAGENAGDVAYVTCGPFECSESSNDGPPVAPPYDITNSPKCAAWQSGVDVELRVGYVDNTVAIAEDTDAARAAVANDGVDVGWVYESTEGMTVEHHFNGASNGKNYTQAGPDVGKTSRMSALNMVSGANAAAKAANAAKYAPAIIYDHDDEGLANTTDPDGSSACLSDGVYADLRSSVHRPDNCFRIVTADADNNSKTPDPDWLGAYTIKVAPKGANLDWGSKVDWEEDPFKDHTCKGMTFTATEEMEVDVCELFQEEVATALEGGWAGSKGTGSVFQRLTAAGDGTLEALPATAGGPTQMLGMIRIPAPTTASTTRFATLWFSNNDGGKNEPDTDLYADTDLNPDGSTPSDTDGTQRAPLQFKLVDSDNDPIAEIGDFGKVDFNKDDPDDTGTATLAGEDGTAENGNDDTVNKCSDNDGRDGCNAMFSEDIEVTFATGTALGCDPIKKTVTITCEWNAKGELGRYRADDHTTDDAAGTGFPGFTTAGASGPRVAGYIGAFAECTVK